MYLLFKHSASKCNQTLLRFIIDELPEIRKKYKCTAIIVYPDMVKQLKCDKLPIMYVDKKVYVGNTEIMAFFRPVKPKGNGLVGIDAYMNNEIMNGEDNVDEVIDTTAAVQACIQKRNGADCQERKPKKSAKKASASMDEDPALLMENYWKDNMGY